MCQETYEFGDPTGLLPAMKRASPRGDRTHERSMIMNKKEDQEIKKNAVKLDDEMLDAVAGGKTVVISNSIGVPKINTFDYTKKCEPGAGE